jgi:hypothetical protein
MKKILSFLLVSLVFSQSVFSADQWAKIQPANNTNPGDIGSFIRTNNEAIDRALSNHNKNVRVQYLSAATLTVTAGTLALSNSDGSIRQLRKNASTTTVTWANIDTDSEESDKTYYVWGVADTDAETFTVKVSLSSTAPSGCTYYALIGSFYNDASGNIIYVNQYPVEVGFGAWASKSNNTVYQAATDGFVVNPTAGSESPKGYTDASNPPTTQMAIGYFSSFVMPVRKGDYWKVTGTTSVYWIPIGE